MLLVPPISTLFPYTTLFRSVCSPIVKIEPAYLDIPWAERTLDEEAAGIKRRLVYMLATEQSKSEGSDPIERSEEHTSELQSPCNLVCRLLLEKKKNKESKKA